MLLTDKELKHMSRAELLELLIEQMEENERLRLSLAKANAELADRQITLERAGSIAKAALELNKVFEAADLAARQYVESVRRAADTMAQNAAAQNSVAQNCAEEGTQRNGERKAKRT